MIFNYYNLSKLCLLLSLMAMTSLSAFAQGTICNVEVKFENTDSKENTENVEVQIIHLDKQIIYRRNLLQVGNLYENVTSGNLIVSVFRNTSILDAQIITNRINLDCSKVDKTGLKTIYVSLPTEKSNSANESKIDKSKVVHGDAIHLGKPSYPKSARAANVTGSVNVRVIIDREGYIIFAKAATGHPLLKNASEDAAVKSKYTPTLYEDQPVEVSGIIIYNFN